MIEVKDLSIGYGEQVVIANSNMRLSPSKVYALVGPNGSGKSTLLRTLAAIQEGYSGSIQLGEFDQLKELSDYSSSELSQILTWMPSKLGHVVDWKVEEFIQSSFQGKMDWRFNLSEKQESRYQSLIHEFEIKHMVNKTLNEISDGELQRVLLCKSLCRESRVLLLDEPISFIDLPHKFEFVKKFIEYTRNQGYLILYSSHDLKLSLEFSDEIVFINEKQIDQLTPEEFRNHPRVQNWLGESLSFI